MTHLVVALALLFGADPVFKVSHLKDETLLVKIKADAPGYAGKEVIICGSVEIDDYYNYAYRKQEDRFQSIRFREIGSTSKDLSLERCHLYIRRLKPLKPTIDYIAEYGSGSKAGKLKTLARVRVVLDPAAYETGKQWNMLEVVDIQFASADNKGWEPWLFDVEKQRKLDQLKLEERAKVQRAMEAAAKEKELEAENAAEERALTFEIKRWRTFKNPDGVEVKAKYSGINSGNVKLIDEEGNAFKLPLSKLSKEDLDWIKKKPWIDPEAAKEKKPVNQRELDDSK